MMREPSEKERFEILLEEMRSNSKAVMENQNSLITGLRVELKNEIHDLSIKVDLLEKAVTYTNKQLNPIQITLTDHEHRIKKLEFN